MEPLSLTPAQAAALLIQSHGIEATGFHPLGSELASTFRVSSNLGDLAVKIQRTSPSEAPLQLWRAEIADHVAGTGLPSPGTIRTQTGALVGFARAELDPQCSVAIIVTEWIDAAPYATLALPPTFGRVLGTSAAQLQLTLATLSAPPHPIAHPWAAHTMAETIRQHLPGATLAEVQDAGHRALEIFDLHVKPVTEHLPRALVHQDLHDDNVLATPEGRVAAIIDFDDMLLGWRVAEPSIAAAYFARTVEAPLDGVQAVADGWESIIPFTESERAVFLPLAVMRLALNAVIWDSRSSGDRHGYAASRSSGSLPAFWTLAAETK